MDVRGAFNIFYLLASGYATCFTVFTRRHFGSEALGINGIAALLIMFVYMARNPASDGMRLLIPCWLAMLVLQRISTAIARGRGAIIHSRYVGYPWFGFAFPFVRQYRTARQIEAVACIAVGAFLCKFDLALGHFVLFGFFGLIAKNGIEDEIERKMLQRMHDAEIEQQHLVELRNRRGY